MPKLIYKIAITGEIKVITGLHIGGSDSVLDIGGIDNSIIKTKGNVPYIPGSSLKGKLRALIAKTQGSSDANYDNSETKKLFQGNSSTMVLEDGRSKEIKIPTRLLTRDSFVLGKQYEVHEKTENKINRTTGIATPRLTERVSPDSVFGLDLILDVYDVDRDDILKLLNNLKKGFDLLENDYLGGSGSRGYGKVEFSKIKLKFLIISEEPEQDIKDFNLKSI
jgi:CRISPR-associated protein Csm3